MNHRETQHELWLAMRGAHIVYRHTAEACDAEVSCSNQPVSPLDRTVRLTILVAARLAAFENYVEARMDYSEFLRDCDHVLVPAEPTQEPEGARSVRISVARPLLKMAVACVVLLGIIGLSYAFFTRERTRAHDVTLNLEHVRKPQIPIQSIPAPLVGAIDGLHASHEPGSTEVSMASPPTGPAPPDAPRKDSPQKPSVQIRHARASAPSSSQGSVHRNNAYEFDLTLSRRFRQVGRLGMSLRKVDGKRKSLDLSIRVERSKLIRQHLHLNTPVWIVTTENSRPIELVATSINRNDVHVRLSQLDNYRRRIPGVACAGNCLTGSLNQDHQEVGRAGFDQRQLDLTVRRPGSTGDDSGR